MDIFVIGDQRTILGFSLIGVQGRVVGSVDEARSALEDAVAREEIKIVLITQRWASRLRAEVDRMKTEMVEPLVLDIPRGDSGREARSLRELVEEAVGIRIGRGR